MSRSRKGTRAPGYEFNSARGNGIGFISPGRYAKNQTHRRERAVDKRVINEQTKDI